MIVYIKYFLLMLFMVSVIGYIFAVLKEKLYLKNNIILINKKSITQEHIDEADMKEFVFDGCKVKSGDEIKVVLKGKQKLEGIVIGAKKKEKAILMVTHDDKIRKLNIDNIIKFKIVSKYGKFF